jgi:hypothetical protein
MSKRRNVILDKLLFENRLTKKERETILDFRLRSLF